MSNLHFARDQMARARDYTCLLLDQTPVDQWLIQPAGAPTHIAWQVGHLAMAQFRLCILFIRPVISDDRAVIDDAFMAPFRKGSTPTADASAYPSVQEIVETFHHMHDYIMAGWDDYAQFDMNEPTCRRSPVVRTKAEALMWASRHEMFHTGQISLLRRMLGAAPLW